MNYEDKVNHILGDIKKKLDSIPEENWEDGYELFCAYLLNYKAALLLGGEGFIKFSKAQMDITGEMLEYMGKINHD